MKTYELFLIDRDGNTSGYYKSTLGHGFTSDADTLEAVIFEMRNENKELWDQLMNGNVPGLSGYSIAEINPKTGRRIGDEVENYREYFSFKGKQTDYWREINGKRTLVERWYMYDLRG